MSLEGNFITSLTLVQTSLYRYGGSILIGLGSVSCIMSLIVFTRKHLRKNPCSIYFVAFNISNLLLIFTSILFATLALGYNIDPSSYNLSFCRFRFYTMFLFDILSPSYLILASIDRILITSRNVRIRQRSTPRLAYVCITITTLFWLLLHSHILILTNFTELAPGFALCYFRLGLQVTLMNYYSIIIKGIVIPLSMVVLGLWAVRNVRSATGRVLVSVLPISGTVNIRNQRANHSKDRQLLRILLIDISAYVVFNLMMVIVLMYQQFNQNQFGSLFEAQIQAFLIGIGIFSSYIPFCIGCYTNFLASRTFRHEVKNILMCQ